MYTLPFFDKNQLSYKKNKEKAFLLWEKFVLLHSLNGKKPPGGTLQKSSLTDFHNLFQREVQDSARLAFFGRGKQNVTVNIWRLSTKIFSKKVTTAH